MLQKFYIDSLDVAPGNAIPSENDVCIQTFLFVSSQPLVPQKYLWYQRNQDKKGKRFCKIDIYEVNIKHFPISLNIILLFVKLLICVGILYGLKLPWFII